MNNLQAVIVDIIDVRDDIRIIFIKPQGGVFPFEAGQYIAMSLKGYPPRSYSVAGIKEGVIEIHVKDTGGQGASTHIVRHLKKGDVVSVSPAQGDCTLSRMDPDCPLLFIAGGMGISPVKALLAEIVESGYEQPVILYWGTQSFEDQYIKEYFDQLAAEHPLIGFISVVGKLVGEAVCEDINDLSGYNIYLAGSPPMVAATISLLMDKGADRAKIHTDNHAPQLRKAL